MAKKRRNAPPIQIAILENKPFHKMQVLYVNEDGTKTQLYKHDGLHSCQLYAQGFIDAWDILKGGKPNDK
jgi:hypothetical protein